MQRFFSLRRKHDLQLLLTLHSVEGEPFAELIANDEPDGLWIGQRLEKIQATLVK